MGKPPTEKPSHDDFPLSPLKWDQPMDAASQKYGFIKEDEVPRPEPRPSNTPGKAVIAAIIIILLIIAYTLVLLLIPASIFGGSDNSSMQLDPNWNVGGAVAMAEEESGSAPLAEMMKSDTGEQIAQHVLNEDSEVSPAIRLIEAPLMIEQHALQHEMTTY